MVSVFFKFLVEKNTTNKKKYILIFWTGYTGYTGYRPGINLIQQQTFVTVLGHFCNRCNRFSLWKVKLPTLILLGFLQKPALHINRRFFNDLAKN